MSEARSYENEVMSRAQGEAAARIGVAESGRNQLVKALAAEAKRFTDVLPQYRENQELFTQLYQSEAVQRVFTNAQERLFIPARADGRPRTMRLDLTREPLKQKPAPEPAKEDKH